ncbi:Crp/Fnr family transcriptional regulator [Methylobacterium sp. ID0610]|uniref:Crp/Fnr family transcriptional regulator n=1 Tax=Methylobacterium carpenticola TaxID=3344827 RepID=UPI00367CC8F9
MTQEGNRPSNCYLLVEGWLIRCKVLRDSRRQILSLHVPGEVPDLHALYLHATDCALATLTHARVACIPHEAFRTLIAARPTIAAALWRETLIDAQIYQQRVIGLGRRGALGRIAHLFCETYVRLSATGLAKDHRCEFPLTQADVGDAVGLSTVHVNRSLQTLRAEQLISWQGRSLEILNWKRLVAVADFDPAYLHLDKSAAS